ncbi:aminopeptidase P family protein [Campylobacter jejuni]|uniref:aminopeptidase P family protein n=1 Tax=Campylobacter jejuni TaxID=197 RepID=UPI000F804F73|nr:aminopeptidase P family protein [Campylobacter jejuni]RTJ11239.1 Xaa-Pro aminopeptidase [Campylobacter jejuni]RTJ42174.1 Xaa-Pro aminopeptidase [Campylobacter jejuni]
MNIYAQRIEKIRSLMIKNNINIYLILNSDPHLNEYIPKFYQSREFLSGFTGSAGTLIITLKEAFLWTDGRYFIQAEKELKNSNIILQKQSINNTFMFFLNNNLNSKDILAIDFTTLPLNLKLELENNCKASLKDIDLVSQIWDNRPKLPKNKIYEHELKFATRSRKEKLKLVRDEMQNLKIQYHLISSLDDIAWITNLRGSDIEFNPVFLSHLLITQKHALLFIDKDKIDSKMIKKLEQDQIYIKDYSTIKNELSVLKNTNLMLDNSKTTAFLVKELDSSVKIINHINPSVFLKSCKNIKEIKHIKNAMIQDGVALCRFFAWLEDALKKQNKISEIDIDTQLTYFRSQDPLYISNSFATIAGFNANSALPHYKATKENYSMIKGDGLLLIDSGAQYKNGTTDITRVIPIGKITKKQIHDYTLVLKAHIALSSTIFPENIAMPMLDSITRSILWKEQIDFAHGSGHGVGYFLNVHEGPQTISCYAKNDHKTNAKLGMLTSIEPGIYRPQKWGIRLENLVINAQINNPIETEFGNFLCFETVSLCPFELKCIDIKLLNQEEKKWLNTYHQKVFKKLSPKLKNDQKTLRWLKSKTKKIT